jgi:hypothetical protein
VKQGITKLTAEVLQEKVQLELRACIALHRIATGASWLVTAEWCPSGNPISDQASHNCCRFWLQALLQYNTIQF